MHDPKNGTSFETVVRRAFARLTREDLPRAAESRGWPIRTPAEFEELLLAHLGSSPSDPEPCMVDMVLAVELGEGLLSGQLCCHTMNRRVRCEAAKGDPRRAEALKALLEVLAGKA
ncbi:hypothetical protein [Amaricoccus sp.]|uniref:hypothetical protein n=1 Tax=Amaricoccus sp. TaxID=1872485 RepID=UPI0026353DFD|nr:hypothetical protein [Amaricoccus sp.]HRO11383.1 hypothetical protein [Amaricoccus sp.]